ncbi:Fic family protein [Candidatus Pacearchaeota archaeon]|nr:Fic family protein [Candidatus Pacearchaeota archaeon]
MIISGSLANDIDRKKAVLVANPDYFLVRQKRFDKQLRDIRGVHSWLIEHPEIRNVMLMNYLNPNKDIVELLRQGVENLDSAWHYLLSNPNYLSSDALIRTGALIEPGKNKSGFRDVRVSLGMNHVPPNPIKVPQLVGEAFDEVTNSESHDVEKAAMLHLRLAGIQPFIDGNKRTSRLYQDRMLYGSNLPVAFIPVGERSVYLTLLDQGWEGLRDDRLELQEPFVNYIGGKVNTTLDTIIGDINRHLSRVRRR